ncbi:MAG: hypothetical protein Q3972_03150 [Corynebacterium sp.]|nr:hypothetical protein [Corynebacterium sp.]
MTVPTDYAQSTLIVRAIMLGPEEDIVRHIGINSAMGCQEFHRVMGIAFGLEEKGSPWAVMLGDKDLTNIGLPLGFFLAEQGDTLRYTYGLWDCDIELLDIYPRDAGTPEALCIGGGGDFMNQPFDLSAINARLTGREATEAILATVHPYVRGLIERSGMFDFVPLLQALDLGRPTNLAPEVVAALRLLPFEEEPAAKDAYWAMVLALASLGGEALGNEIVEATMDSLGWEDDDGSFLTGPKIRALCARSLDTLAKYGAYGVRSKSAVERLEYYREILRATATNPESFSAD